MAAAVQIADNFHAVVAGEVYRSAQPDASDIGAYAKRHGVRTILNLRGAHPGATWYDSEIRQPQRLGLAHLDFAMSARRELTPAESAELIALMRNAPKPLLIHCKFGSDRTGLASALYLAAIARKGEAAAEAQLSIRYGHIALPVVPEYAMDRSFEAMEPALGYRVDEREVGDDWAPRLSR
jgi:protein tyrosine/serine phosphatase